MKFPSKKKETEKIEHVARQSRNFEISLADQARKSERRAWLVALAALLVTMMLLAGYIGLVPLKEKVPYLVMADPYTGTSTVARLSDNFQNETITTNEAINKSNVARFVIARESYDWDLISRRDWNIVNAMGDRNVVSEYRKQFEPTNPHNPDTIYGQKMSVRVKIKAITLKSIPSGKEGSPPILSADVRFDRIVVDKQAARIVSAESYIASMAYEYKPNLAMKEEYRIENPLGFRVISYRVDPEGSGNNVSTAVLGDIENIPQAAPAPAQPPIPGGQQPSTAAPSAPVIAQPQAAPAQPGGSAQ